METEKNNLHSIDAQAKMDNDLKIAILNFLSATDQPYINSVRPSSKDNAPIFEEIFYYIKNLPANRGELKV